MNNYVEKAVRNRFPKRNMLIRKRAVRTVRIATTHSEMDLKGLRELVDVTQTQLAKKVRVTQAELSRAEGRRDHRLSTLRRYVEALGGKLEVVAHLGKQVIPLKNV